MPRTGGARCRRVDKCQPGPFGCALGFGEAFVTDWQAAGLVKVSVFKPVFATIEPEPGCSHDGRALRETVAQVIG